MTRMLIGLAAGAWIWEILGPQICLTAAFGLALLILLREYRQALIDADDRAAGLRHYRREALRHG